MLNGSEIYNVNYNHVLNVLNSEMVGYFHL